MARSDPTAASLTPLPRTDEGHSRYLHPNGYVIEYGQRTWSERVGAMRGASLASPYRWWSVYEHLGTAADLETRYVPGAYSPRSRWSDFDTLREARQWCDERPRAGWGSA